MYIGEAKRPLGKRFKEHTNLTIPTGVGDHCNATGHSVSLDNTKVSVLARIWIFPKKGVIEFFRELFAKERSYPSTTKIAR